MGFFDKKSSSRTDIDEANVTSVDNRVSEGDIGGNISLNLSNIDNQSTLAGGGGVNATINTSDFGALDTASEIADQAFNFASASTSASSQAVKSAIEVAETATKDEAARTQQFLILGGVVVAIAVAFVMLRGKK